MRYFFYFLLSCSPSFTAAEKAQEAKPVSNVTPPVKNAPLKKETQVQKNASLAPKTNQNKAIKPLPHPPSEKQAIKLAADVQKKYQSLSSLSSDFEQEYTNNFPVIKESSKGHIYYLKNGGKMVWQYEMPEKKAFYIDGNKLIYHIKNIAYVSNCAGKDSLSASLTFLQKITDSFTPAATPKENIPNQALSWVTLIPKDKDGQVKKILLGVNKKSEVEETVVEDLNGGNNHFKFKNYVFNSKKFDNTVFNFDPSKDKNITIQPMPNMDCPPETSQSQKPAPKK